MVAALAIFIVAFVAFTVASEIVLSRIQNEPGAGAANTVISVIVGIILGGLSTYALA